APAGSSVVSAGRFVTVQCQKPEPVGASGSKHVTANACVPSGNPDHDSCGETSSPPGTPIFPDVCGAESSWPSAMSVLVTSKRGGAVGLVEGGVHGESLRIRPAGRPGGPPLRACSS